jgi:hypothetical protein
MKKKGNRNIPDFSRKRPQSASVQQPQQNSAPPPVQVVRTIKPNTSAKSGRRGT